nr:hypothetical protein [Tanacetum cinerariifolium]
DPGENSSQSSLHIDHHCYHGCGDSLDDIFCHQCTCESCRNGAHYGYNCPPKGKFYSLGDIIISELPPCIAIKPVLSTEEPKDSLIMGDKHLDIILEKELDKLIKSSVEDLVLNPSEFEDLSDIEKLLYDNSSPHLQEEFNSENSNAVIESFSPSPILVKDSDCLMEEIDLSLTPDDSMPPGIENDDYDSEGDIIFLKELLNNDSFSLPKNESFHFDVPSFSCPPVKPPDDFDDSCSWFCPSITRSSYPQFHFGNPISKSYRQTFIFMHT